jgi:hypothetical protein
MLWLVINGRKQAPWQQRYEQTYRRLLLERGIPFTVTTVEGLGKEGPGDFLWVMHYQDLNHPAVAQSPARTIFRMSGTSVHPFCYQVDVQDELRQLTEVVDFNLSFHPRMTALVAPHMPGARFVDTGYPIEVPAVTDQGPRVPKTIVVGGRLSPDKQFMLSAFLLQPYVDQGFTVTFCYPDSGGKDSDWMRMQGGFERWTRRGFRFEHLNNQGWLRKLAESEFYFTASLGDTACCSCVEAVTLGAYPLVPKIKDGLPAYDVYIDQGYEPFSQSSLDQLIRTKPPVKVDDTWFNPDLFMDRLCAEVLLK